jgi:hypothetical protein
MPARPPRSWELQTITLLAAISAATLLAIVLFGTDLAVLASVRSSGASGMSPFVSWIVRHFGTINSLNLLVVLAYVTALELWRRHTRRMLARIGDDSGSAVRHWTLLAFNLAIGASFLLRLNGPAFYEGVNSRITFEALQMGIRALGLSLLILGVWQVRIQVRAAVAEAGILLRRTGVPKYSAAPAAPLTSSDAPHEDVRAADDEYWTEVSELAASTGADLALLEAAGPLAHRWHVIPKSGDVDAIRGEIPPGAVLTVFPIPPTAEDATGFTPPPADRYHSFLETQAGDLQYQSVSDKRVPAFLARTQIASRWALYPTETPDALRARMPSRQA